jgi:hypothetical protein
LVLKIAAFKLNKKKKINFSHFKGFFIFVINLLFSYFPVNLKNVLALKKGSLWGSSIKIFFAKILFIKKYFFLILSFFKKKKKILNEKIKLKYNKK